MFNSILFEFSFICAAPVHSSVISSWVSLFSSASIQTNQFITNIQAQETTRLHQIPHSVEFHNVVLAILCQICDFVSKTLMHWLRVLTMNPRFLTWELRILFPPLNSEEFYQKSDFGIPIHDCIISNKILWELKSGNLKLRPDFQISSGSEFQIRNFFYRFWFIFKTQKL